ncbi:hypothetical protein [Nocardioides sp. P5_C9_2]
MAKATLPKPVLAYVGVTDLAVEIVRDLVTETQTRIAGVQKTAGDPKALADRATTVVNARVDALAKDAKSRREAIEARVADLQTEAKAYPGKVQKLVDDSVDTATDTYADLVKRGETLVGRVRRQESTRATVAAAKTTKAKAKTTTTQAKKAVEAETTATKRTVTARKTAAKKSSAAKKSTTKSAASKAPASKTTASKSTASKTTASKTAATKAPVRTAPAKKTTTAQSSAKATVTAAQKTAASATQAVTEAAEKVGD